jgi:AI-2 transport system permease protein
MPTRTFQTALSLASRREVLLVVACLATCLIFAALSPFFLTAGNLSGIARNSVELLLVSLGITFILATGGIDISVGSAMGIAAICAGFAVQAGWPALSVVVIGLAVGLSLGCLSALVIVYGNVPPIIATLGLFGIYRTAIFLLLGGQWISGLPDFLGTAVTGTLAGVPIVIFEITLIYLVAWFILRWTPVGTGILATGGNEQAARLAGINVARTKFFVYGATGLLVGAAALLYVARYRNVETGMGSTVALDAIVASILGGASVLGGKANLLGTALGVVLVRILQNGFVLAGVPSLWEQAVIGCLLLLVLTVDALTGRFKPPLRALT